ncbi:MAG: hypothetical protein NTV49_04595 [Kiritimatiellaeota bacterium]|nr:hypothetical protein [Kiritimatiellota bacterium]
MPIKSVLREELENSLRMQQDYERELAKLPQGSLVRRLIKGHVYYYLIFRLGGRFHAQYRGKVPGSDVEKYRQAKEYRAKYRKLLSQVKKQVRFLRSALRGKEPV